MLSAVVATFLFGQVSVLDAAATGDLEAIRAALGEPSSIHVRDSRGRTPLMLAAERGHFEIVRALVEAGADMNARALNGWGAVIAADISGHGDIAEFLTNRGGLLEGYQDDAAVMTASDRGVDPVLSWKPPPPAYPERAREKSISGDVTLQILVDVTGETRVTGVLQPLLHATAAAIDNAERWRWTPAFKDGQPVACAGVITVSFDLTVTRGAKPVTVAPSVQAGSNPGTRDPSSSSRLYPMEPGIAEPRLLSKVDAAYTDEAIRNQTEGVVLLGVTVLAEGGVGQVRVLKGLGSGLDDKAVEAVQQWRFAPGTLNGTPVVVVAEIEIRFALGDRDRTRGTKPVTVAPSTVSVNDTVRVKKNTALYSEPSLDSDVVERLKGGESVRVLERGKNRFWSVRYGTTVAFVHEAKLASPDTDTRRSDPSIQARSSPGTRHLSSFSRVYRMGPGIAEPRLLSKVDPAYTDEAIRNQTEGVVVLEVIVLAEGRIGQVRVLKGLGSGLDDRAIEAVQKWRFAPGMRNGTPVAVVTEIEISFSLGERDRR